MTKFYASKHPKIVEAREMLKSEAYRDHLKSGEITDENPDVVGMFVIERPSIAWMTKEAFDRVYQEDPRIKVIEASGEEA